MILNGYTPSKSNVTDTTLYKDFSTATNTLKYTVCAKIYSTATESPVPSRSAVFTFDCCYVLGVFLTHLRLVFTDTVLTTAERALIVQHYFPSYGIERASGPCHTLHYVFRNIFTQTRLVVP